ncbi:hypothetical protein CXG81DRAFT_17843 [Caulochytrium protostelioides]|uniref:D-lactate dehydratase n=1 Tax=Caulochytrium protostelioides TaxID=1555241 RepID=A0A4V1IV15_9FUNG|nr:hypothetical protein CXG81DRAFT_17843 [Caulochytrium protostelioides]|eukprot:RKP02479.1 hypothetical protein CXG81DRAFT_17843 [Caulochytrium protostelioides]
MKRHCIVLLSHGTEELEFTACVDILRRSPQCMVTVLGVPADPPADAVTQLAARRGVSPDAIRSLCVTAADLPAVARGDADDDDAAAASKPPGFFIGRSGSLLVPDTLTPPAAWDAIDALVLPGGLVGAETFAATPCVPQWIDAVLQCRASRRAMDAHAPPAWVGLICAAPLVLARCAHVPRAALRVVAHPSVVDRLHQSPTAPITALNHPSQQGAAAPRVVVDPQAGLITSQGPGTAIEFALVVLAQVTGELRQATQMVDGLVLHPAVADLQKVTSLTA